MELLLGIIVGILVLVVLVVLHELGHAIAAKSSGVVVEEFGVGFPPKAWSRKLKDGMLLSVNWLPLGGFVKLKGEYDSAKGKGDYGAASFWNKTKILFAGVMVNWLFAAILLSFLALVGIPKVLDNQFTVPSDTKTISQPVEIVGLKKGYPAEKIGLKTGDKIIRFAGKPIPDAASLIRISKENRSRTVKVVYSRANKEYSVNVKLLDQPEGVFGAALGQRQSVQVTWSAPIVGFGTAGQFTILTLQSLGDMLGNLAKGVFMQFSSDQKVRQQASSDLKSVGDNVAGPIGILGVIFPSATQAGLVHLTFLTAIISLSLAVMNALPIPSLDGGRWFTMALFRLLKKNLTKRREERIQTIGFSILMGLILLVTIVDVAKLF